MSKAINNPNFIATNDSPEGSAPVTGQILDGFDFPHTGLIKVFNLACAGSYAIRGFNGTNIGATSATFAGGAVFLKGTLTSISGPTTVTISGNSPKTHHLLVARAGAIVLIQGTVDNEVPPFVDGDVIIALLKYTGSDPMQIQYLTFNQTSKALSIGRLDTNTSQYLEGLSIKSVASGNQQGHIIIESFESDKDIIFKVNDGGSGSQEVLRIDASEQTVGIGVNGIASSTLHIQDDAAGDTPKLTIENRNAGTDGGAISFVKDGSSPANNDTIGTIFFESESALSADHTYADISVKAQDTTNSAEGGRMNFRISKAGSLVSGLDINHNEVVVNETSKDINFRVESDTNQNMLVVDSSTDRIGIGTDAPATMLHLKGSGTGEPKVTLENNNDDSQEPQLEFKKNGTSPANSDDLGIIRFVGDDSNGSSHLYAFIMSDAENVTAGAEEGRIFFFISKAGTTVEMLGISHDEIVVNEAGAVTNFRVESDSNANMIFVDGTNNRVGIGTNAPAHELDVAGAIQALSIRSSSSIKSPKLETIAGNSNFTLVASLHAGTYVIYSNANGTVTLPATSAIGEHYTILNTTGGNITVGRNGNNINGAASNITVGTFNGVTCISIGSNDWIALGV